MEKKIDPWSNDLMVDYQKLFDDFGMQKMNKKLLSRIPSPSRLFRRGIVFGHRDFDKFITAYEKGEPRAVMSGIKPSGDFHLGHKLTAEEMIFMQSAFKAKVFYGIADLEAYADNGVPLEEAHEIAVSNLADMLALGLDPDNAFVYKQSEEKRVMNLAYLFARRTTTATLRALYGDRNIGLYFSCLTQAGDILLPEMKEFSGPKHVVVPVGVDQDPHIRLTRDIAQKFNSDFGFISPAATYHRTFRALNGETKMSKRDPMNMLSLSDEPKLARKKIMRAFTGGKPTVEEQKKTGGDVEKCVVFELFTYHFEEDDGKLAERRKKCLAGGIMCGECKKDLADAVEAYLKKHQEKKKKLLPKAREMLEK